MTMSQSQKTKFKLVIKVNGKVHTEEELEISDGETVVINITGTTKHLAFG